MVEQRRQEIALDAEVSFAEFQAGKLKIHSVGFFYTLFQLIDLNMKLIRNSEDGSLIVKAFNLH